MWIGIIAALALLALVIGLGFYLAAYAMGGKRQTLEEARAWQEEHYDLSWYDGLDKADYTVKSDDGYALHVQLVRHPSPAGKYVILSHGYTDNRFGALKYGRLYLDRGFSLIVYDLRGHGLNAPTFCTYSVRERRALLALIRDSRGRYPDMKLLGLHGESLGAATTAAVLGLRPPVDFAVCDCGFAEITSILRDGLRGMKLPGWLVHVASACAKVRYGYGFGQMRPVDALPGNRVPMLFIHGAEDTFIPPEHSRRMQAATAGKSELVLIEGATHAKSVLTDPKGYAGAVGKFLDELGAGS